MDTDFLFVTLGNVFDLAGTLAQVPSCADVSCCVASGKCLWFSQPHASLHLLAVIQKCGCLYSEL